MSSAPAAASVSTGSVKAEISTFLDKLDTYQPTIPTEVSSYHLSKSGCSVIDTRMSKLVSLAADKFLAEVIYEAKQATLLKNKNKRHAEEINAVFTMDALCVSLKRKNISVNPKRMRTGSTRRSDAIRVDSTATSSNE